MDYDLITTDQRGFTRSFGAACDIGAVEFYPYVYLRVIAEWA